ncbi:MAG: hypothetical protein AXA67_10315 [Methylothermaceae bacteria B42]|nr:MAG: hypothetical protein AXA67_10315 [Methylothermaceae bacteria B42]HHJ40538.1 ferrous iron transport protein A [Methylothermaceae bacterium]
MRQATALNSLRPLSQAQSGQKIQIMSVPEKRAHKRLLSMGLPPGSQVTVLRNRSGSVIVGQHGDRLAIGRKLAEQILVSQCHE